MGSPLPSCNFNSLRRQTAMRTVLILVGTLSGCASGRYMAANLPAEWQASPVENAQTLELAKIASPTVQTDRIGRGDVIRVNISTGFKTEDNPEWVVRVSEDGTALLPDMGPVPLEGLELETAEVHIGSLCREKGLYRTPQVTVTMEQPKVNNVMVIGAVNEPNMYELRSGSSGLLDALVKAGGLSEFAGTTVEIRHPGFRDKGKTPRIAAAGGQDVMHVAHESEAGFQGPQTVQVDLISATQEGRGGYYLPDGSVVNVQRHDPLPIHVAGLVQKAGVFVFPVGKELTLLDAVAEAGGISNPLANKVYIIRSKPGHDEPILIEASLRRAKNNLGLDNPKLIPGDYVSVEQTPGTAVYEALRLVGFGVNGRAF
ncbi:MAG: polysaccharide biosynthesis/export family protein [Planctomycetaceae bacterium]|nr:polysaccharide biosynthesis/export family protein [Planctomycetaceae bacterium]